MLKYVNLKNVGPAPKLEFGPLGSRLNLIAGDNGLGKSFLLDVAWWALTRRWPAEVNPNMISGFMARPTDPTAEATIDFALSSKARTDVTYSSKYIPRDESWLGRAGRPWNPGLVLYAHSDGGFSVWDPARNYWKMKANVDVQERLPAYVFSAKEVWDGLKVPVDGKPTQVCNGLLADWASWIRERGRHAKNMATVLKILSESTEEAELLRPGELVRLSVNDARDIPSIQTAYSDAVPILFASAGIRRVTALAYMLLWSWNEHQRAAKQLGEPEATQVVILIDEIESHLHPRWQRTILPSMQRLAGALHKSATIQLIVATHSPLVLASAEPKFAPAKDTLWKLDLHDGRVRLERDEWRRRGDVDAWLLDIFDLPSTYSVEAAAALERAAKALSNSTFGPKDAAKVDAELRGLLSDTDPFWSRWHHIGERKGWLLPSAGHDKPEKA